jgi:hypothetical protein
MTRVFVRGLSVDYRYYWFVYYHSILLYFLLVVASRYYDGCTNLLDADALPFVMSHESETLDSRLLTLLTLEPLLSLLLQFSRTVLVLSIV